MIEHPLEIAQRELMAEAAENLPGDWVRMRRFDLLKDACSEEWRTVVGRVMVRQERVKQLRIAQQIAWN